MFKFFSKSKKKVEKKQPVENLEFYEKKLDAFDQDYVSMVGKESLSKQQRYQKLKGNIEKNDPQVMNQLVNDLKQDCLTEERYRVQRRGLPFAPKLIEKINEIGDEKVRNDTLHKAQFEESESSYLSRKDRLTKIGNSKTNPFEKEKLEWEIVQDRLGLNDPLQMQNTGMPTNFALLSTVGQENTAKVTEQMKQMHLETRKKLYQELCKDPSKIHELSDGFKDPVTAYNLAGVLEERDQNVSTGTKLTKEELESTDFDDVSMKELEEMGAVDPPELEKKQDISIDMM